MTPARAAYRFFALTLALLIGYALVHLLAIWARLPDTPLPAAQLSALAAALLDLALISGLIGGGIYALQPDQADARPLLQPRPADRPLLAILTLAAGVLDCAAHPLLSAAPTLVIALVLIDTLPRVRHWTAIPLVWSLGIGLSAICALLALSASAPPRARRTGARRLDAGGDRAGVLPDPPLQHRLDAVGGVEPAHARRTAGAGGRLSELRPARRDRRAAGAADLPDRRVAQLSAARPPECDEYAGGALAGAGDAAVLARRRHDRRDPARPRHPHRTAGTWLSALPEQAALWAIMAIILGAINQIASELRADQRRITGLVPFWLVAFSLIGSVLLLAGIGLVQVYVERLLSVSYPCTDDGRPCSRRSTRWAGSAALLPSGLIIYGFLFLLRNPQRGTTVDLNQILSSGSTNYGIRLK